MEALDVSTKTAGEEQGINFLEQTLLSNNPKTRFHEPLQPPVAAEISSAQPQPALFQGSGGGQTGQCLAPGLVCLTYGEGHSRVSSLSHRFRVDRAVFLFMFHQQWEMVR